MGTKTRKLGNVNNRLVEWQTVKTSGFTAVAGEGYFVNTTGGSVEITLPSGEPGDTIMLKDYARTWATNNCTLHASSKIDGQTSAHIFSTNGQSVTLIYADDTKGYTLINEDTVNKMGFQGISATGGTVAETGDYKVHTFTGDGNFVVASIGANGPTAQISKVDYIVVAGGAGGGTDWAAGSGAGGFREAKDSGAASPHTASPLAATTGITVSAQTYPITVGGGGAGGVSTSGENPARYGANGSNSVFSTITSAGGGSGAVEYGNRNGQNGGSGGGKAYNSPSGAGEGNNPPTSPPQGNDGGTTNGSAPGGGGGGASAAGGASTPDTGGAGGAGATTVITGSSVIYAGGGGGVGGTTGGAAGPGGGGAGSEPPGANAGGAGTANRGGGGGAGGTSEGTGAGGAGGKGVVIIRYKFQ